MAASEGLQPVDKTVIDRAAECVPGLSTTVPEKMPIWRPLRRRAVKAAEPKLLRIMAALSCMFPAALTCSTTERMRELSNRLVCFATKQLGKQLKTRYVTQDQIWKLALPLTGQKANHRATTWTNSICSAKRNRQQLTVMKFGSVTCNGGIPTAITHDEHKGLGLSSYK